MRVTKITKDKSEGTENRTKVVHENEDPGVKCVSDKMCTF